MATTNPPHGQCFHCGAQPEHQDHAYVAKFNRDLEKLRLMQGAYSTMRWEDGGMWLETADGRHQVYGTDENMELAGWVKTNNGWRYQGRH